MSTESRLKRLEKEVENKKCKHKWVAMEDGTLRKFCVRCAKFAKQAQMSMPMLSPLSQPLAQPVARETMEVPFYTGSEHIRINVDKENFLKEMYKEMGLPGYTLDSMSNSVRR